MSRFLKSMFYDIACLIDPGVSEYDAFEYDVIDDVTNRRAV